ncbi:MAG: GGDEF domain-containing protein [Pseudomonadota bacterium]
MEASNSEPSDWKERIRNWSITPGFRANHEIESITKLMPYAIGIMLILSVVQWYSGRAVIAVLLLGLSGLVWLLVKQINRSGVARPFVFTTLVCGAAILVFDAYRFDPVRPLIMSPIFPLMAYFFLGSKVGNWFSIILGLILLGLVLRLGGEINPYYAINILICYVFTGLVAYQFESMRVNTEESLEHLSFTDVLTGAHNRRMLDRVLNREINRANREFLPLSIIMMDVDEFKQINDEIGHIAGDQVLKQLCQLVQENIRTTDYMIRFGGDEFIIVTPTTDQRHAEMVTEKIQESIRSKDFGIGRKVVSSIGIAEYEEPDTIDSLLNRVDKALYKDKARKKSKR